METAVGCFKWPDRPLTPALTSAWA